MSINVDLTKTTKEYIVFADNRPFFATVNKDYIAVLVDEARSRFGKDAKIAVYEQVTTPYPLDDCD